MKCNICNANVEAIHGDWYICWVCMITIEIVPCDISGGYLVKGDTLDTPLEARGEALAIGDNQ